MENIFLHIKEEIENGRDVMLNMIIASSGSTPRGKGAKMLVYEDGTIYGTMGGGNAEHLCTLRSVKALKEKESFTVSYDMSQNDIEGVGMICGGNVEVCFRYFSPSDIPFVKAVLELIRQRKDAYLITRISENAVDMGVYDEENGVRFISGITEEEAKKWSENIYSFKAGEDTVFVERLTRKGTVYIFGAGHVSRQLAPLLKNLDFRVVVYEQRKPLADAFVEGIDVVAGEFKDIDSYIDMIADDYAVIMTSGHSGDFDVLNQVLRKDLSYIGVIGSRSKIAITRQRLLDAGVEEKSIDSLHTPIGLAIKAVTPAEIAVSVAAELILHRAENEQGEKKK